MVTSLASLALEPEHDRGSRLVPGPAEAYAGEGGGDRSSGYLAKKRPGRGPGGKELQKPLPPPEFSEDSSSLEEPPEDNPSSCVGWGLPSPGLILVPREPPVSLQTLTFCWDSSPEEEEEGGGESESEDSSDSSCGAKSLQRIEVRGRTLGHYLPR